MVYTIVPQGIKGSLGFANLSLLKGDDERLIEVADTTPDGGLYFGHGRDLRSGRPVKTEHFPKMLKKESGSKIPDFDRLHSLTYVSDKFKSIVEAIEPAVHQFIPFQIVGPHKAVLADMWFIVVCNRLDSVDREHTTLVLYKGRDWVPGRDVPSKYWPANFNPNVKGKFVFNLRQIGDHHLWYDKHSGYGPYLSDALADALKAAGITGADLIKQEAV